jgi:hypothetical protein
VAILRVAYPDRFDADPGLDLAFILVLLWIQVGVWIRIRILVYEV